MAEELTVKKVLDDFQKAYEYKRKFLASAQEDVEFTLGKMWEDKDVEELRGKGVRALTINKIRPNLFLLKGLESQNRSEFKAYPEGKEDQVTAEIATILLKNVMKNCDGDYKISEVFEDGNSAGESYIEPFINYPYKVRPDLSVDITGRMKLKKTDYCYLFPEAGYQEYDMSDAGHLCKVTYDVSKDELKQMFPEKEEMIDKVTKGQLIVDGVTQPISPSTSNIRSTNYQQDQNTNMSPWAKKTGIDLLDYYYKKYVKKYFVADLKAGTVKLAKDKKEADNFVAEATKDEPAGKESARVIERSVPEIWVAFVLGGGEDFLANERAWSYPRWESWPFIPYFCFRSTMPLSDNSRDLGVQGVTRLVKDLNRELNKRRTQELRHLNQSTSSGWLSQDGAWKDVDAVDKMGSSPGFNAVYNKGYDKPERIFPMPISQGHAQAAAEHQQDMKEVLGINTDLLAVQEGGQSSGRAIALRQKQGIVMVQGIFDNLSRTKKLLGKFILSQLKTLYTAQSAARVLGAAFIKENFSEPVIDPRTQQPVVDPRTGQFATQVNQQALLGAIDEVLNDTEIGMYDVTVGENVSSETIAYGNYLTLLDMAKSGIPVPPDVLVEESNLAEASKKSIVQSIQTQRAAQTQPQGGGKK